MKTHTKVELVDGRTPIEFEETERISKMVVWKIRPCGQVEMVEVEAIEYNKMENEKWHLV